MHPRAALCVPFVVLAGGCAVLEPTADPTPVVRGPLEVVTNGPIVGTLLQFRPRATETTGVGRLRFEFSNEYSSMFEDGTDGHSTVLFDGEILRCAFRFRTGLSPSTDVEIEAPLVYASAGFLDDFVTDWHALFGFPNGGRGKRPHGEYAMHATVGGRPAFELDDGGPYLGDVPITLTQRLFDEADQGFSLALRGGVQFPTGSESRGVGNGGVDWGGGLLAQTSVGRFTFQGAAYYVEAASAQSFEDAGIASADQRYVQAGAECRWNEWLSFVAGLRSNTPATRGVTIEEVNGRVLDLDLGFVFDDPQTERRLTLGLSEDLISESGPDFTVFFAWSFLF